MLGRMPDAAEIKLKEEQAKLELQSDARCVILIDNKHKQRWDIFIAFLLIITAFYVPIRVSFWDTSSTVTLCIDTSMDLCFFTDIILTFFTAVPKRGGLIEYRHKYIAKMYMQMWFWIDLTCSIPVQFIDLMPFDSNNNSVSPKNVKIIRLARLPRLWRIVRIIRLFRTAKLLRDSKQMKKITEFFNLTSGVQGLIRIFFTVVMLNHISSCLWFMIAKFNDFEPNTWVVR